MPMSKRIDDRIPHQSFVCAKPLAIDLTLWFLNQLIFVIVPRSKCCRCTWHGANHIYIPTKTRLCRRVNSGLVVWAYRNLIYWSNLLSTSKVELNPIIPQIHMWPLWSQFKFVQDVTTSLMVILLACSMSIPNYWEIFTTVYWIAYKNYGAAYTLWQNPRSTATKSHFHPTLVF